MAKKDGKMIDQNRIGLGLLLVGIVLAAGCSSLAPPPTSVGEDYRETAAVQGFEIEELVRQRDELKDWANQLAEGYGPGIWYFNATGYPLFHHSPEDTSLEGISAGLNVLLAADGNPQIILDGVEGSAVRIRLSDDAALTQGMGSTGAQAYLQVVLYSLTSLPEIDCVDFQFAEGDHAQPGLYCR